MTKKETIVLEWRSSGWYKNGEPVVVKVKLPEYKPTSEIDREIRGFLRKYDLLEE